MNQPLKRFAILLLPVLIFLIHLSFVSADNRVSNLTTVVKTDDSVTNVKEISTVEKLSGLYTNLNLENLGMSKAAFAYGIKGYNYLRSEGKLAKDNILTIIDFSLPSTEKRLFVIDVEKGSLLYNTYVSHGRNSGTKFATQFSNLPESYKSSLGFYVTRNTYTGKHGFSLRLNGEEKGINDNAMSRAIVMHAADYVNKNLIKMQGYIGRSLGCPALPNEVYKPIINEIKDGSCLFIYSPSKDYQKKSPVLFATANTQILDSTLL